MPFDVLLLSRLQFAFTVMFHYLFPPLTIGLGVLLVLMEGMYFKTGDKQYEVMAKFWTKIFAVNFAMGVVTGLVLEFEFGTNWASYSRYAGDVFGSLIAAEGLFAFFLESTFLGVLVFGWDRVSRGMHFFAALMVSLGSMLSAVWIVVVNSWQQTPAGFRIVKEGDIVRAEITDFWAMVFNPSSVDRLIHVLIGAWIMGAFFVMSVSAYYILQHRHETLARKSFSMALVLGLVSCFLAVGSGHHQAKTVSRTQPAKLAAFEGHYKSTEGGTPLYMFGWPDDDEQRVKGGPPAPGFLSFLVHGDFNQPVTALDQFPKEDWPPVWLCFQTYHMMVGVGFFLCSIMVLASYFRWRGVLFEKRWLMWAFVFAVAGPVVANQAGWVAAEVGRQPWLIYGVLRTSEGVSQSITAGEVLISLILFGVVYLFMFAIWAYVLIKKILEGPDETGVVDA